MKPLYAVLFAVMLAFVFTPRAYAAGPTYSEADYAIAAATGMDPAVVVVIENNQAKVQCAGLTSAECDHSYVTRTNAFAKTLGVPTILEDVGDNVGRLNFAGLILNAIGRAEYP